MIDILYSKAFKCLKEDSLERKTILASKMNQLRRASSPALEAENCTVLSLKVGETNFRLLFAKYDSVAQSALGVGPRKKEYHLIPKAAIYLTFANLLFIANPLRAGQLYEAAAQLQSHSVQPSTRFTPNDYRMIAHLYWNAAILKGYQSSFSEELLNLSFHFFDTWLASLKKKVASEDFHDVAVILSLTTELINSQTPEKRKLVEQYREKYLQYFAKRREEIPYPLPTKNPSVHLHL